MTWCTKCEQLQNQIYVLDKHINDIETKLESLHILQGDSIIEIDRLKKVLAEILPTMNQECHLNNDMESCYCAVKSIIDEALKETK